MNPHVEMPTNPRVKMPINPEVQIRIGSYPKTPKIPVVPKRLLIGEPEITPPKIIVAPIDVNWNDPNIRSIKSATDDAARSAAKGLRNEL